jgi:hypothetical protein
MLEEQRPLARIFHKKVAKPPLLVYVSSS